MFDPELAQFKTIDLRSYAASQGYLLDKNESARGSAVMRHANGDKIIVKRDATDGHFIYFSVRDDRDNGSIIDFVMKRLRINLGTARKELRPWIGASPVAVPAFAPLRPTERDKLGVEMLYAKMADAPSHPYLEAVRALPASLLASPRFLGRIRIDARGNAVFPHWDIDGLCGFEIKNAGFTGFSAGGTKGLWTSHHFPDDNRLVVCESAIDALSHAVLYTDPHARYASIGGKPNPIQKELIRAAAARMPAKSKIVAAMDADEDGGKLAELVKDALQLTGREDLAFVFQEPVGAKDWNDVLRLKPQLTFPYQSNRPTVA
jgi:hypothetical protein